MRKLAHELCWCELLLYILLSTREFLYNPVGYGEYESPPSVSDRELAGSHPHLFLDP
jgi:hypothetical protein